VVLQGLSDATIAAATETPIQLERIRIHNDNLRRVQDANSEFLPSYIVSNSPVVELNGTYIERGRSCDTPKYEHVRGWTLLRCLLPEIEELGISASEIYDTSDRNQNRLTQFYNKAGKAKAPYL
jgi:hypothetical protein